MDKSQNTYQHTSIKYNGLVLMRTFSITLMLLLSASLLTLSRPSLAGSVYGFVYTRQVVTNEAGNRTWGEYDPQTGSYLRDIGEATGDLDPAEWRVMSGDEYRGYVNQKNDLHSAQSDLLLKTRTEYEAETFLLADGVTPMSKPALVSTTASVSVLPPLRRLINDPASLILAEYPINPDIVIADGIFSLLHKFSGTDIGTIKNKTTNRIGFKVAFAKDGEGNPVPIEGGNGIITGGGSNEAMGPIVNAKVEGWWQTTSTRENGAFALNSLELPCPGFFYSFDSQITLELHYRRFNPKAENKPGIYTDSWPSSVSCESSSFYVPLLGPIALGWHTVTYPNYAIQFAIDLTVLSGTAQLSLDVSTGNNRVALSDNKVPIDASTQYQADSVDNKISTATMLTSANTVISGYDFDRDGENDTLIKGYYEKNDLDEFILDAEGKKIFIALPEESVSADALQGVWLSSSGNTPQNSPPDLTRVMDSKSFTGFTHQGLLAQISAEDLRNTDIYVVRVSDGKLISERIGLNEYEATQFTSRFGEDAKNSQFFYTIKIQGNTGDKRFSFIPFDKWQAHSGINPDLHQREADHLQPGDAIRIYAINRATGYIVSV